MIETTLTGVDELQQLIGRLRESIDGLDGQSIAVATEIVYAYGIETGRYRSGRLARAVGGSFALTNAFAAHTADVGPALALALWLGKDAVRQSLVKIATDVQGGAATGSPRVSGTLAASFTVVPGWR